MNQQKSAYQECRELFEASVNSHTYRQYIEEAIEAIDFYEGRQWAPNDVVTIRAAGLRPVTVNLIAQRIDALAGKEASTRTRFRYKSRSGSENEVAMADDISALGMFVQEKNRTSRLLSQCRHHARIVGIGWHSYEVKDNVIREMTENPLEVVWDVRDHSPLLTNQGFVARVKWMTVAEAKLRFPDKKDEIDKAALFSSFGTLPACDYGSESAFKMFSYNGYWNAEQREVAVVEFQYRVPCKYWTYATEDGLYETFSKKEAEKNAIDKDNVQQADGYKVMYHYFIGDVDLDGFESPYQISPAKGSFLLTPTVNARELRTGVPYGAVRKAIDSQRLYNTKQAKLNWLMSARQVIMDEGAADVNRVRTEINKPNGIIVKKAGKELRIDQHAQEIAQHYQALAVHSRDIEVSMGIYDEALGVETNAQSGVAIQRRQAASASTQMYSADGFSEAQYEIAHKLLGLLQTTLTDRIAIDVTDDEGVTKRLSFNETVKVGNKEKRVRDIRLGTYDVVIEQIPDTDSLNEVAQLRIMEMLQTGLTPDKWTPGLLDLFNVPKNANIRKEIEAGVQQKMAQLQELQSANGIGDANAAPMSGGNMPTAQPNNGMSM